MKFPRHLSLTLTHNDQKINYETVAQHCEYMEFDQDEWVSEEQRLKAIDTNELWELQWYPDTPVGLCSKLAADLDALLKWAEQQAGEEGAEIL